MKNTLLILFSLFFSFYAFSKDEKTTPTEESKAYPERGKIALEIIPWEAQFFVGGYLSQQKDGTGNFFGGTSYTLSFLLPTILSADYKSDYTDKNRKTSFDKDRILWIRPVISMGITDKSSNFLAFGNRFTFPVSSLFLLSYNLSFAWIEASAGKGDGLDRGLNFYHVFSISKKISRKINISLKVQHLSNGKLLKGEGASHTSFGIALGYQFNKIKKK